MSLFKKRLFNKKKNNNKSLTEKYVPAVLPSEGMGLENYVPAEYPENNPEVLEGIYKESEKKLKCVIQTCDQHSDGAECDAYVDNQVKHLYAEHEGIVALHETQIQRIDSARVMRKKTLMGKIKSLQEKIEKLNSEIKPVEDLEPQFCVHLGRKAIAVGLPVTIIAMVVDAAVNYASLSEILLVNIPLLIVTLFGMTLCSDVSMWGLATFLNHKEEKFTQKPLFCSICVGLFSAFILSVVASFMIRYGSMDTMYGTINSAGEFVGKNSYSLAEYGATLIGGFVTTASGLLSFAFSLDKNAFRISVRERKKKELADHQKKLEPLQNELCLIENAPDPRELDEAKRAAAKANIEALRTGLKLYCRKLMLEKVKNADFTDRMAASGEALMGRDSYMENIFETDETLETDEVPEMSEETEEALETQDASETKEVLETPEMFEESSETVEASEDREASAETSDEEETPEVSDTTHFDMAS